MKVLVADRISPKGVAFLKEQDGFEVVEAYGSSPEKILELVADVHAIIVRSETKVTKEVIEAAPSLKAVGRAGVGVDNIDIEAASNNGVVVMNTPSGNTIATAELTFTHLLCGARPVAQACASMSEGKWNRKAFSGIELNRKTLAILGMGRIGSEVAKRAQAFGMEVMVYDPFLSENRAKALNVEAVDLEKAFTEADFITVHMPLTDSTKYLINEESIAKMKDGVRLFNCARGGIIKESALLQALESGKVAAAGLDVYESEPLAEDSPLRTHPNVVLTPHLGASTEEAQESVGLEVAEAIKDVLAGGVINNAVNMPSVDAKTLAVLGPYLDLGGRLGSIVQQISPDSIEKLVLTYYGKIIDFDANALTRSILHGFLRGIHGENVNYVNAPIFMKQLGVEVEVVKSSQESDYTELVRVEAQTASGERYDASGTLLGTNHVPRVIGLNGRDVETSPFGFLLILRNEDLPGMVGVLGRLLGEAGVNIAAMSLSRDKIGGHAITVLNLDSEPSKEALNKIQEEKAISDVILVKLPG
ncbi:MAG: phosphoglycerate dehydrogenase [Opitutales bacterium]|nr:phosphoglycerate dehydrogenase [Opitutales bacterium]MCH8541311.1 phosphoglycerate dehydrogenase [Opitutales bacterium]